MCIAKFEQDYLELINRILSQGVIKQGRNGSTKALFGETLKIDMTDSKEFPLLHTRKIFHKGIFGEFAAMVRGPSNVADFQKFDCNYWNNWGDDKGNINVDYGNLWLDFNGVNQLEEVARKLKETPNDRRIIISGWDPSNLEDLSLPCCHILYQWFTRGPYLDMIWYQRSVDTMVGLPSDIVLAAIWNIMLANEVGLAPGEITMMLGDTHIYSQHEEGAVQMLKTRKLIRSYPEYTLSAKPGMPVTEFLPSMISLTGYNPIQTVKFDLIV